MHIALFFTYEVSAKDWLATGLLSREIQLYKQISNNADIEFTFITYGSDEDFQILSDYKKINVLPIGNYLTSQLKITRFLKSLIIPFRIRKELKAIDLLKTNQLKGAWIPIILKLLLKKQLIIRTGYDLLDFAIKEKKSPVKIMFYYLLTLFSLLCADKYLVSSKNDLNSLKKRFNFIKNKKIEIRHNWVNITGKVTNSHDHRKQELLMVGRLESQKNYLNVISNISGSNLTLDIIGEGSLKENISDFAKQKNVKVNFFGTLDHIALLQKYAEYKYYVLYSQFEGHPKTLLEAMSQGCVPLVLNNENISEIVKNDVNGIILEKESDSILQKIEDLNNNTKNYERLSGNARSFILKSFSLEKSIELEIKDYSDLIQK